MHNHKQMVRLQAEQHPCVSADAPQSPEDYAHQLMKVYAYTIAARLAKNKSVLDVGCNDGYGTKILAESSAKTTGVDVSQTAIQKAIAQCGGNSIEFRVADGAELPFEANQFDVVVSFQVIEHVVDCDTYLSEIKRTLKQNGIAVLTTPNAAIRLDPGMKPWNCFHVREYTHSELKSRLQPYFSCVAVRGLFAEDPFYSTIINRMARARQQARNQQRKQSSPLVWRLIKKAIPRAVFEKWNAMCGAQSKAPSQTGKTAEIGEDYKKQFTLDQLEYRPDNLDAAMNLMAICTDDKNLFETVWPNASANK